MLFGKKSIIKEKEINQAYKEFLNNEDIILLCVDEAKDFDIMHLKEAQCFPLRRISNEFHLLPKDAVYYVYAFREGIAYQGTKKLINKGFKAYNLGSQVHFKGYFEGLAAHKNRKLKRKKNNYE